MAKRLAQIAVALAMLIVLGVFLIAWSRPRPARLDDEDSVVVEFRDGTPAHVFLSADGKWRIPVAEADVDRDYVEALLRLEDKRFYRHLGVDPLAIARAAITNVSRRRVVSGASTITMQLARLLEPRPRTMRSKLIEAVAAIALELSLEKRQILEAYLELAPFGGNIEGVEAASLVYFGHSARSLSRAEIATLLAIPQDPTDRAPASPANRERLRSARDLVARRLVELGSWREEDALEVAAEPLGASRAPLPRRAMHAAVWLRARHPGLMRIRSTLDRELQEHAERVFAGARSSLAARGIMNGAGVLVEHETREVRALIGNFDFWDAEHGGEIPGFAIRRSTGSTLKPFIFAMAIDRGIALPEHLVPDVPLRFGAFAPRNFDGGHAGLVRLSDALSSSLNVPFVWMLRKVGVDRFTAKLRALGADPLPGEIGLSAAIGGLELTPLEVAALYASLARDGKAAELRLIEGSGSSSRTVLTPGAAYMTRRALAKRESIHWKTGTSYGLKDAWAAGSGARFTAVVWAGNFDNRPSSDLIGAEAAAPLFVELIEPLEQVRPEAPPRDLISVEVCSYSGHVPSPACPHRKQVLAPERNVPATPCPYHVELDVDVERGLAVLPSCAGERAIDKRAFLVWPASVRRYLRDRDRALPEAPSFAPGCGAAPAIAKLEIVSPPEGRVLIIPGVPPERQQIPLEADAPGRISWFVDGQFIGAASSADERVWWTPRSGAHEIAVVDQFGSTARRKLVVAGWSR